MRVGAGEGPLRCGRGEATSWRQRLESARGVSASEHNDMNAVAPLSG